MKVSSLSDWSTEFTQFVEKADRMDSELHSTVNLLLDCVRHNNAYLKTIRRYFIVDKFIILIINVCHLDAIIDLMRISSFFARILTLNDSTGGWVSGWFRATGSGNR